MRNWILTLSFITLIASLGVQARVADDPNIALNHTYVQFTKAFTTLDPLIVKDIYAEDACYIPEGQSKKITQGRDNIVDLYKSFFGKINHKNAQIEVDFRVVDRQIEGRSATDVGYYLVRFHPPAETEEPVSEFAGKFVTVSKQKEDGQWFLTVDTSQRAEPKFYFEAKPLPNLYFGNRFTPIKE